jgi:hypothetical protein
VIAMANWGASKKRRLMHRRGIEYANGRDHSSMVRRVVAERSTNDRLPRKSKEELRADVVAAFIAWREKRAAQGQS